MEKTQKLGRKLTADYALIQSVYNMINCCLYSFAAVFLLSRGFSNSLIGVTITLASGFSLIFQPSIAAFADSSKKFSLRSITVIMMAATLIFSILLIIVPPYIIPTIIFYILMMVLYNPQISLVTSLSMEHINRGIPINFSLARGIGSVAYAALSFSMGFLVDDFGPWVVMLINTLLGLAAIFLVSRFRKTEKQFNEPAAEAEEKKSKGLLEFALQNKRFFAVIGCVALIFISQIFVSTFMIQIIENVGGGSSDMGIANAIAAVIELPAMAMFPLIYKRIKNAGAIMKLTGVFFVIKIALTFLATSVFWVMVAQCFQFFAYALFLPASVYYVNEVIGDADKVKGQTLMGMVMGISGMIGSFVGGFILDSSGGVSLMLLVGTIVSFIGMLLLFIVDRRRTPVTSGAAAV